MNLLHIAVIGLRGIPDVMGGIETHCTHLLPRIIARAPEGELKITVLARRRYAGQRDSFQGIDVIPLWCPRHRYAETIIHTIIAIFYARFRLHAHGIHLHGIGPALVAPLARLLGLQLLFTHHGEDYRRQKWGPFSKLALRMGEIFAVVCAHRLIAVSKSTAERVSRSYPRNAGSIVYIPNGFSPETGEQPMPEIPEHVDVAPGQFLLSVGRLVPEKGHDVLIAAYRRSGLADRRPPCKLLIAGAADHPDAFSRRIENMAGDGVVLPGRLPRDVIMRLNRSAALFVLPSYHEGLSIAALEAISAGAPVLLSDIDANRDIGLSENLYFATGSVEDLAEKLTHDFRKFSIGGDFDVDAFDWDNIAKTTLQQFAGLGRRGALLIERLNIAADPGLGG